MLNVEGKNAILVGATTLGWASLHSAWPGATGLNEIAVSRVAVQWGIVSAAKRQTSAGFGVTVPGGHVVAWLGLWSASTGGTFQGASPISGLVYGISTVPANSRVIVPNHPFMDGQTITFFGGTPPAPLVEGAIYYVRDSITDQFRVAGAPGGSAITLTAPADAACLVSSIAEITVGSTSIIMIPRITLRWKPNYPPVWNQSVTQIALVQGATFDLRTICSDADGDILTFALASGSEDLPTGISLSSSGLLTASSSATIGSFPWVYFTADDGQ